MAFSKFPILNKEFSSFFLKYEAALTLYVILFVNAEFYVQILCEIIDCRTDLDFQFLTETYIPKKSERSFIFIRTDIRMSWRRIYYCLKKDIFFVLHWGL